ncbi:hypothetical protein [Streptomyces griseoruber]|nr:hypothetical protein [Streptomyces griseoruber]
MTVACGISAAHIAQTSSTLQTWPMVASWRRIITTVPEQRTLLS